MQNINVRAGKVHPEAQKTAEAHANEHTGSQQVGVLVSGCPRAVTA